MWFIVALIVGAGVLALAWWLNSRNLKMKWYVWFIGIIGLLLLMFTIQNYFGSIDEFQSGPAAKFWLVTGLPAIILLGVAVLLAWRRQRTSS